jgi:hypothetical protein
VTDEHSPAPHPSYRLIPSRFPPIGLFDAVATAADLEAVMELAGWTNDRLVAERIGRLPRDQWVYGRPNASVVMASFLHVAPGGMRFNASELGAWYAAAALPAAAAEVGHHLRREASARSVPEMSRTYRTYTARLTGRYRDIRGADMPDVYASESYAAGQVFGEGIRTPGGDGIVYDSLRYRGGVNVAAYRPTNVKEVVQTDHYDIRVRAGERRIEVWKLPVPA